MYKHSTTHRTLSRRLAALLAALALLAAMALPVYAEALDGTTGTAQAEIGDTISDGTVTTENGSTTSEGKEAAKDSTANADGNNASKNEDTNDNASPSTTGDSNTTAGNTVNDTLQTLPADNIDPTADKTTTNDTLDTMDEDEDAKQDSVTRSTDDAEESHITQMLAAQTSDSSFKIYFAVPTKFAANNYTGVKLNYQKSDTSNNNGWPGMKKMELLQSRDYLGRKVYVIAISLEECPEYFQVVQFHYMNANGNIVEGNGNFEELSGPQYRSNIANKLYDADSREWVDFTPYDPNNHQTFAGKTMLFQNQSDHALTDVKAVFYENDQEVETIDLGALGTIAVGKRVSFKIPEKNCTYIRFIVGGVETPLYSFYGQQDGGATDKSFIYDSGKAFCYIYQTNDSGSWATPQGKNKIYFDATFSKMETNSPNDAGGDYSIPAAGKTDVYYRAKGAGVNFVSGSMTQDSPNSNLYYVELNAAYTEIAFSQGDLTNDTISANNGQSTAWEIIPQTYENPCFYADTYDDSVYGKGPRSGYWDKKGEIRDAEKGKNKNDDPIVDVPSVAFAPESGTKYINTTLYDYYTDWELNGNNRDKYNGDNGASQRNWVTFRQFDQALSDYYQSDKKQTVLYPIYTGHFQPNEMEGDKHFSEVASALNLYGWDKYNTFMAVNNSYIDINGNKNLANPNNKDDKNNYVFTFQGLVSGTLNKDGNPTLYNTDLAEPHFNKAFLEGDNSKNAVLGKVYENVDFPFTKEDVFKNGVSYWHYESNDKSLFLKQKAGTADQYFLQQPATTVVENKMVSANAQNLNSSSGSSGTYGFFPFNEKSTVTHANTYNYGFGAKLQFDFTLTDDGKVLGNNGKEVPIQFFFSGDDDVWVYIDNELALDVGGAHGEASGLLEFGTNKAGKLVYTPYVSKVKPGNENQSYEPCGTNNVKKINYLGEPIEFNYKGNKDCEGNQKEISAGKHTLKFFYMERGMWESNMAIAFNFPDHNELQVQKIVKDSNVNKLFKGCFDDQRLFNFTIRNQATHYGTTPTVGDAVTTINLLQPGKSTPVKNFTTTATHAEPGTDGENRFTKVNSPPDYLKVTDGTPLLNWYTQFEDLTPSPGSNKNKRYGILRLDGDQTIDITGMSYLSFDVYVDSNEGDAALSNMYLQLRDSSDKKKGCLGQTFIGGKDLYGQVEMHNNRWITVKLSLDDVKADEGFDEKRVKELRFGCNYPRSIYLRNIVFSSKAVPQTVTGFTTKQEDIADYGSAKEGKLMPAVNAQYTSDAEQGTMVVDKNGGFVLKAGETISFKDQFRRGSYLSINEQVDKNLFDTQWTIYEDGMPVKSTTAGRGEKLKLNGEPISLKDQTGTAPDDGRIELENAEGVNAQNGNSYKGEKPSTKNKDDNTIVFRSYANPDATDAEGETQLKVVFVNTVKTGSLTIKKEQDGKGENLDDRTYTFRVRFTNVGGHALEDEAIVREYPVTVDKPFTIDKIPVGTRFTIEELTPEDGSKLTNASVTGGGSGTMVLNNLTVRGSIVEGAASDGNQAVATFTNTRQETLDITGEKVWKDANGTPVTSNLPDIYVQLQRRHKITQGAQEAWQLVKYQNQDYRPVINNYGGMKFSFLGLPAKDYSKNDKPDFEYRVVEGYVDTEGFHAVEEGKTITIDEKVYCVTYNPVTVSKPDDSSNNAKQTVTITNRQQDPKFTLDVTKKSAENDGENDQQKLLAGVEFTLEKLNASGQVEEGYPKYGITNDQGKLMIKGEDGNPTNDSAFTGLEAGKYRLTETKAAENYNLLSAPIVVTFTTDGTCTLNGSKIEVSTTEKRTEFTKNEDGSYTLSLTVLNRKTPALPHTGADAPSLWLLIGLPLAVAGLLILVFRYNKKGGRTR